mgnify:FL=1
MSVPFSDREQQREGLPVGQEQFTPFGYFHDSTSQVEVKSVSGNIPRNPERTILCLCKIGFPQVSHTPDISRFPQTNKSDLADVHVVIIEIDMLVADDIQYAKTVCARSAVLATVVLVYADIVEIEIGTVFQAKAKQCAHLGM